MAGAVEAAYKNRIMAGRFPGCVLQVTVRPASVDVNVHPAKTEVKFFGERAVYDAVFQAAKEALDAERRVPEQAPSVKRTQPREDFFQTMTAEPSFAMNPPVRPQKNQLCLFRCTYRRVLPRRKNKRYPLFCL